MQKYPELIGAGIALAAVGLFTSAVCGYFAFVFSKIKNNNKGK